MLTDGLAHIVDSSELAFRLAVIGAIREVYFKSQPVILEPIMTVEVIAPTEFQSNVIGGINTRRGTILNSEVREDEFTVTAEVPLSDMFGYSNALRGATQGKGEFTMEYKVCPYNMVRVQCVADSSCIDPSARAAECAEGARRGVQEVASSGQKIELLRSLRTI